VRAPARRPSIAGSERATAVLVVLVVFVAALGHDSWRAVAQGGIVKTWMTSEKLQDKLNLGWGTTRGNTGVMMLPYTDMRQDD